MTVIIGSNRKYVNNMFDLRWCLDYFDKPTKNGMWNIAGAQDSKTDSCWRQSKNGFVRARIEAKDRRTRQIITVPGAECHKDDFITFRWIGATSVMMRQTKNGLHLGDVKYAPSPQGLTLVSRDVKISVFINGETKVEPNNESRIFLKEHSV